MNLWEWSYPFCWLISNWNRSPLQILDINGSQLIFFNEQKKMKERRKNQNMRMCNFDHLLTVYFLICCYDRNIMNLENTVRSKKFFVELKFSRKFYWFLSLYSHHFYVFWCRILYKTLSAIFCQRFSRNVFYFCCKPKIKTHLFS